MYKLCSNQVLLLPQFWHWQKLFILTPLHSTPHCFFTAILDNYTTVGTCRQRLPLIWIQVFSIVCLYVSHASYVSHQESRVLVTLINDMLWGGWGGKERRKKGEERERGEEALTAVRETHSHTTRCTLSNKLWFWSKPSRLLWVCGIIGTYLCKIYQLLMLGLKYIYIPGRINIDIIILYRRLSKRKRIHWKIQPFSLWWSNTQTLESDE